MSYDDEDDWVGTPPEGRYTRDRAKPEFWAQRRPLFVGLLYVAPVLLGLLVLLLVLLT